MKFIRYKNKIYVIAGPLEIHYGRISKSIGFWYKGRYHIVKKGRRFR